MFYKFPAIEHLDQVREAIAEAFLKALLQPAAGGRELVVHPRAIAPRPDQPGRAHDAEVARDLEVGRVERLGQLADAGLAFHCEQHGQPQAGRIGQDFEQVGFGLHRYFSARLYAYLR